MRSSWVILALSLAHAVSAGAQRASTVRLVPEAEFDGGTVGFVPITGAVESASGRVAVLQQMDSRVLVFERDGRFAFAFGRKGAGPSEFTTLNGIGWAGDSLWVWDRSALRITLVAPTGTLIRTIPLTELQASPRVRSVIGTGRVASVLGLTPDSHVLARYGDVRASGEHIVVISPRRQIVRRIAGVPSSPGQIVYEIGKNRGVASISFSQPTIDVGSGQGPTTLVLSGPNATATTTVVDVIVVHADADTILARRLPLDTRSIPTTARDSAINRATTSIRGPAVSVGAGAPGAAPSPMRMAPEVVEMLSKIWREQTPRFYPAASRAQLGTDNSIWIERLTAAGLREYRVFKADGEAAFTVSLRANQSLLSPSLTHALLLELDEDDVPSLRRVRLER